MTEEDLRSVIATYQTKAFELFNSNIVYETQIHALQRRVESLVADNDSLNAQIQDLSTKRSSKGQDS
jgi:cell division protein FtsB